MIAAYVHVPLQIEKEGNPYRWVPFRASAGVYQMPSNQDGMDMSYLVSTDGREYDIIGMGGNRPMGDISRWPFTHWFTKPIPAGCRMDNHICPIRMDYGVWYLVNVQGNLKFISTDSLLKDGLPISYWIRDDSLFPLV